MSDEETFDRLIKQVKEDLKEVKFLIIQKQLRLQHYISKAKVYPDNLVQIGQVIYVFEGKSKKEESALKQLKEYQMSLKVYHQQNLKEGFFPYNLEQIRLFYYSLKEHEIIEFKGKNFNRNPKKWKDLNELKVILQNIFKGSLL